MTIRSLLFRDPLYAYLGDIAEDGQIIALVPDVLDTLGDGHLTGEAVSSAHVVTQGQPDAFDFLESRLLVESSIRVVGRLI